MKRIIKRANIRIEEINNSIEELANLIRDSDEIDEATKAEMISDLADQLTNYSTALIEDEDFCEVERIHYYISFHEWMN